MFVELSAKTPAFPMTVFEPIDLSHTLVGYGVCLAFTIAWVFFSKQRLVDRTLFTVLRFSVRLALVFALVHACFFWIPRITWLAFIGLAAVTLLGVMIDVPVSGIFSFALFYLVQQFVLGFPARHERIRHQRGEFSPEQESKHRLSQLVGQSGLTVSALRPLGEVVVNDQTCSARTYNGAFLDPDTPVHVIAFQAGKLIVRENGETTDNQVDKQ